MNKAEVVEIAKRELELRGWPFAEPIKVQAHKKFVLFGAKQWRVMTQSNSKGGNVNIWIDDQTKNIISVDFANH